jgi:uncharacterized protein (UPF0332 family)
LETKTELLVEAFLQKAQKKLSVAQRLFVSGDYEDAVSRAYYAAFHTAQALLVTAGERAQTHAGVVTLFGLLFVKTEKFDRKFGKYLASLKDDRENGDYEVLAYIDQEAARSALSEAEEFVSEGRRYLKNIGFNLQQGTSP